jgi:hypothetical protein
MAQHIRNKQEEPHGMMHQQHIRKTTGTDYTTFMKNAIQRIRSSPKMMMGTIIGFILMIILVVVALHYFRLYSFPFLGFIPQKPAPASHLQYFFF